MAMFGWICLVLITGFISLQYFGLMWFGAMCRGWYGDWRLSEIAPLAIILPLIYACFKFAPFTISLN